MQIEIHLPRPGLTLLVGAAISGWALYLSAGAPEAVTATVIQAPPMQSSSSVSSVAIAPVFTAQVSNEAPPNYQSANNSSLTQAEMRIKWTRAEQEFLRDKEDIIRQQLEGLQRERDALGAAIDPALEEQFRRSVQVLTSLVKDTQKAEQFLLMSYRQQWEAEEKAMAAATGSPTHEVALFWPVAPDLGISAYFMDEGYKARFKVDHYAIDIPVEQGTMVLSASDGVVKNVVNNGLGYNYVTVDHGGYATVYGHMSSFSVRVGQRIKAGDPIGLSGGMPGLPGGGSSTGPHLHFGVYVKGVPVDPMQYLPKYAS